jgi:hypothetical protein
MVTMAVTFMLDNIVWSARVAVVAGQQQLRA